MNVILENSDKFVIRAAGLLKEYFSSEMKGDHVNSEKVRRI